MTLTIREYLWCTKDICWKATEVCERCRRHKKCKKYKEKMEQCVVRRRRPLVEVKKRVRRKK